MTFHSIAADLRHDADNLQSYAESGPCRHTKSFIGVAYGLRRLAGRIETEAEAAFPVEVLDTDAPAVKRPIIVRCENPETVKIEWPEGFDGTGILLMPLEMKSNEKTNPEKDDTDGLPQTFADMVVTSLRDAGLHNTAQVFKTAVDSFHDTLEKDKG